MSGPPVPLPLSLGDLLSLPGLLLLAVGVIVAVRVSVKPSSFWPTLIVVNVLGSGPKLKGYVVIDEVLTAFVVLGAYAYLGASRWERRQTNRAANRMGHGVYALWLTYMVGVSVAGLLLNEDIRLVRWVMFFAEVGAVSLIALRCRGPFPFPETKRLAVMVCQVSIVYYGAYLGQGIYSDFAYGAGGRFRTQDYYWAGSAAAVFPTLLAVPASVHLYLQSRSSRRLLGACCLALLIFTGAYFLSRLLWITAALLLISCIGKLGLRRVVGLVVIGTAAVTLAITLTAGDEYTRFVSDVALAAQAPLSKEARQSDARNRLLQLEAGIRTSMEEPLRFLFGAGMYSHRTLMVEPVRELTAERFPGYSAFTARLSVDDSTAIIRTVGFSALLVDAGLAGSTLLVIAIGFSLVRIHGRRGGWRVPMIAVVLLSIMWFLASNVIDMVMAYLIMMPGGLAESWVQNAGE